MELLKPVEKILMLFLLFSFKYSNTALCCYYNVVDICSVVFKIICEVILVSSGSRHSHQDPLVLVYFSLCFKGSSL